MIDLKYLSGLLPSGYLLGATLVAITVYYWPIWKRYKYPPGPMPLPFIGNILTFVKPGNFMQELAESRPKYGEVLTLHADKPVVILNSAEAIYEGFTKNADHMSLRPFDMNPIYRLTGGLGMINENDGHWQLLRRQLLSVFKEQGVGKVGMEECITMELAYLIEELGMKGGDSFDLQDLLTQSVSNIATKIVFGSRFDYTAKQLENLQFDEFVEKSNMLLRMKFVEFLPGDPIGYHAAKRKAEAGLNFAKKQIEEHRRTLDEENPRDFIDTFLVEMNKNSDTFTEKNLLAEVMQLYIAGTDTTSSNLYWVFLYVAKYPEIQQRIYEEISEHVGSRPAQYTDRNVMNYTMSFITEIFRLAAAFMSLPHYTTRDVTIRGQTIPRDTTVLGNIWGACHDKTVFEDADTFRADRFLNEDGKFRKPDSKRFIPFSIGRRVCPGEPLARMEMLLFLVTILQKFEVHSGQEVELSETAHRKFLMKPANYLIKLTPRSE